VLESPSLTCLSGCHSRKVSQMLKSHTLGGASYYCQQVHDLRIVLLNEAGLGGNVSQGVAEILVMRLQSMDSVDALDEISGGALARLPAAKGMMVGVLLVPFPLPVPVYTNSVVFRALGTSVPA